MQNNFDLKKFLVENKLTPQSQQLNEHSVGIPSQEFTPILTNRTYPELVDWARQHGNAPISKEYFDIPSLITTLKYLRSTGNNFTPAQFDTKYKEIGAKAGVRQGGQGYHNTILRWLADLGIVQ